MTTAVDVVAATRRHLYGTDREDMNTLNGPVTDVATTLTLTYDTTTLAKGDYLSIDLEVCYVWSADPTTNIATVQRGMLGSTPAAHASGAIVYVNPRFTDFEIFQAVNDDLLDLSAPSNGLYQIQTLDLTAVSGQVGYDFNAPGYLGVADIRWQQQNTVTKEWTQLTDYTISENLPTTAFASGTALFMTGPQPTAQQPIRVRYKSTFTQLTALTDNLTVTGLPATAYDLPPLGAALRLTAARPLPRADYTSQGDTRRADEVHVNDVLSAPSALRQLRQTRITEEARRLYQQWPAMLRARVNV
jgi:hypothetical protein